MIVFVWGDPVGERVIGVEVLAYFREKFGDVLCAPGGGSAPLPGSAARTATPTRTIQPTWTRPVSPTVPTSSGGASTSPAAVPAWNQSGRDDGSTGNGRDAGSLARCAEADAGLGESHPEAKSKGFATIVESASAVRGGRGRY